MMRKLKTMVLLLLACALLCGCTAGEDKQAGGVIAASSVSEAPALVGGIPCAFPLAGAPASLNIMISSNSDTEPEDVFVWKRYEEMTGVNVNWTRVTSAERAEAVYTALTGTRNIDLILRCKLSAGKLMQYGQNGLLLDLAKDGLLEKNAPNCYAYLQAHPEALASITNPDGSIYALPQINSGAELRVSRKLFVNKRWLDNVGLPLPTTTEELYGLLKAFKEQDANGNGDPNDEIPFCPIDWSSVQESLYGAFGLANRGTHNTTADWDEKSGGVRLIAASDGYRSYLEYLNRLYTEGLADSYMFTISGDQWTSNAKNDRIGVFASTNLASLPADHIDDWTAIGEALEGPNGDKLWSAVRANFHTTGAAAIPASCGNPELALHWLDYFWTDAGTLFYHMGVENETYIANSDGSYDYMPFIYEAMKAENKSFDDIVARYSPYPGGGNPTVEIAPYFMGGEMAEVPASAARSLFEYGPDECWPSFTFTAEERAKLDGIQTDMTKYINSSRVAFITGEKPFSEWDSYLAQLEAFGVSDMLAIYQAAVDRYYAMLAAL